MSYNTLTDFLEPINKHVISNDEGYLEKQIGHSIEIYEGQLPALENVDIVLVGCNDQRGGGIFSESAVADVVRSEFYKLYHWHNDIKLADIGNVRTGKSIQDTYAALKAVLQELLDAGKMAVVLGGSHDLTLAQYYSFVGKQQLIDAVGIDAQIDITMDSPLKSDKFLLEILTSDPNYINHYNHIAFQSYLVHPRMLETMDKLRFDCFRAGNVKEHIDEMEPVLRHSHMLSFDIAAIAPAFAPSNTLTPNGLNGEEACTLMQYAGMSRNMRSIGIYGYQPDKDLNMLSAKQISHMLWYLIDGRSRSKKEAETTDRQYFNEYHTAFAEVDTIFLQSKKTGRWWMQLPDKQLIACSYRDYLQASNNEIPERWLRAQERG